jgi:hypothetical protein
MAMHGMIKHMTQVGRYFQESTIYHYHLASAWIRWKISPSKKPQPLRVLFLSDQISRTNELQFSPFIWFRNALAQKAGFVFRGCRIDVKSLPSRSDLRSYDLIALKLQYKTPAEDVAKIAEHVVANKRAVTKLAYFDGIDDLCVHWPTLLDYVDFYVKRHAFKDRSEYLKNYVGSTNLTDYVFRKHGAEALDGDSTASGAVKAEHLSKIILGLTFGMDEWALQLHRKTQKMKKTADRPHDVVCRADIPPNWMANLRKPIGAVMERLRASGRKVITPEKRVSREEFYQEMSDAKIYISPFGYGEICGRDYECVILGSLLIKPDMSHVEVLPDIYRPLETYIPVAWDYSDLEDTVQFYLDHPEERLRITERAARVVSEAYQEEWFVQHVMNMRADMGFI